MKPPWPTTRRLFSFLVSGLEDHGHSNRHGGVTEILPAAEAQERLLGGASLVLLRRERGALRGERPLLHDSPRGERRADWGERRWKIHDREDADGHPRPERRARGNAR